jgi:hypothetical protein
MSPQDEQFLFKSIVKRARIHSMEKRASDLSIAELAEIGRSAAGKARAKAAAAGLAISGTIPGKGNTLVRRYLKPQIADTTLETGTEISRPNHKRNVKSTVLRMG